MIREALADLGKVLTDLSKKELEAQGHKATGRLLSSWGYRVTEHAKGFTLEAFAEDYSKYVEKGRRAGTKRVPIQALIDWIKVKGIESGDKEIKNAAFAIQAAIFREGIPTSGSLRFSQTGTRMDYVDIVLKSQEKKIRDTVTSESFKDFESFLGKVIDDVQKSIN